MAEGNSAAAPAPPSSTTTKLPTLGLLEEDDEFEEFAVEDWTAADEDQQDLHQWDDNWDDDDIDDDFSVQLRAELEKQKA